MTVTTASDNRDPLDALQEWVGESYSSIRAARELTVDCVNELRRSLLPANGLPENIDVVLFGSLARGEWNRGSDVDWTLLVDGPADPDHFRLSREINAQLTALQLSAPGSTDTFGVLASSHELVHHIGGVPDTNQNMTRRVLMLLEAISLSTSIVRERVQRQVLSRYIACDQSVSLVENPALRVPRFLLNDIVRFWRTMAVDYAAKKWEQPSGKWALRNAKLRLSRKLLFAKGLFMCLDCQARQLMPRSQPANDQADLVAAEMTDHCLALAEMRPLDLIARALRLHGNPDVATQLLRSYDEFLAIVGDADKRTHLAKLTYADASNDVLFRTIRDLSARFQSSLDHLFFDPSSVWFELIKKYGVF